MDDLDAIIRDLTAAFDEQDLSRAKAWVHDDAVFDWSRSLGDNRGEHEGIGGLQMLFDRFLEAWESVDWRVDDTERLKPDMVLVTTRVLARGRDSGIEIEGRGAQLWELRDGKIKRVTLFQSPEEARAEIADGDLG